MTVCLLDRHMGRVRASLAIGLAAFVMYALGTCPSIYVGDSGELVTAVDRLGIPHPTGYPLYVLAGKLWTIMVPAGSIAWRMSLFSAACAAVAVAGTFALCRRLGMGAVAAVTGAGLLAASPSFWGEATVQRVYALNALFVVAATCAALWWRARPTRGRLVAVLLLCGVGAGNHAFMAVYAVILGCWALAVGGSETRRPMTLLAVGAAFGVGLLPYLYLPLRSRADPVLDWGDPETLAAFVTVVTRRNFWQRAWLEGPADFWPIAVDYAVGLARELGWAGTALAVVGVVVARRRRALIALMALVMLANLATVAAHGSRSDIFIWHRYYIPSYVMAAVLAAFGTELLIRVLPSAIRLAPALVPLVLVTARWPEMDRSRYHVAEGFALAVLDALPPGAHLVATDDNVLFALMYLHFVEHRRPDVNLVLEGVGGQRPPSLRFDPEGERLFFTHHPNWEVPGLDVVPMGLVFEARRPGRRPPPLAMPDTLAGENDARVPKDHLTQNLIGHFHYMRGVTADGIDPVAAARDLARAGEAAPDNDVLWYNLALVHRRAGRQAAALEAARRSHAVNSRPLATSSLVRASDLVATLEREVPRP